MMGPDAEIPVVIAHRGVPETNLEHTRPSYLAGIEQGADYLEPDVVPTADGHLVIRHENEIGHTTDVAERPEFASRRTTKFVDGKKMTGWFSEDFTLAEIKTLRAKERIPLLRPKNKKLAGRHEVLTIDELLEIQAEENERRGPDARQVGVYAETKSPEFFVEQGFDTSRMLLDAFGRFGLDRADAPVVIQSMEVGNLQRIANVSEVPLVQLIEFKGAPFDQQGRADGWDYKSLVTPAGLDFVASYARGIGVQKNHVIGRDKRGRSKPPTDLVRLAHERNLWVHVWTIRRENHFLPKDFRKGFRPHRHGRSTAEQLAFFEAGVDGLFSDAAASTVAVRARWLNRR